MTWLDCDNLDGCGRMEIGHVFALGAVVRRATTHSWGRPAPLCPWSDGRPHLSVVARPATAPEAKTWSIPIKSYQLWLILGDTASYKLMIST